MIRPDIRRRRRRSDVIQLYRHLFILHRALDRALYCQQRRHLRARILAEQRALVAALQPPPAQDAQRPAP